MKKYYNKLGLLFFLVFFYSIASAEQRCVTFTIDGKQDDVATFGSVISSRMNEAAVAGSSNDDRDLTIHVKAEDYDSNVVKVTFQLQVEFYNKENIKKTIDENTVKYINLNKLDKEKLIIYVNDNDIELYFTTTVSIAECPVLENEA